MQHPFQPEMRKNEKKRNGNIIIINIQEQPDQQEIPLSMEESCLKGT
jgi:hypothetical protein